jgi:hypothetical protein
MSMCVCQDCDAYIDSDFDPDCFVEVGNMRRLHQTKILCERCREERQEDLERQMSTSP